MKKVFALTLVLIMVLTSTLYASALDNSSIIQPKQQITAQLVDDLGNSTPITGYLVNITPSSRAFGADASVTYEFTIYEHHLTKTGNDSGISSVVTLTIYYNSYDYNGAEAYLLTRVYASWAIQDAYVSITSATLNYGCCGFSPQGGFANQQNSINPAAYLGGCNVYTEFDKYVVPGVMSVLGSTLILDYYRGGNRRWTFTMQNNLFND